LESPTMNPTRAALHALFETVCSSLNVRPLPGYHIGAHLCLACFATETEARTFADALQSAGETVQPLHLWDPATDPDFDAPEWQVSWGDMSAPGA
jgi:hypothetical protein